VSNRILIFANKTWEAEPLVGVLTNEQARPAAFPDLDTPPQVEIPLSSGSSMRTVQARLALKSANARLEVWCIKDLMDPQQSGSSSQEKARVLNEFSKIGDPPSLVIAFGTAAFPDPQGYSGCVVIGSNFFVYNPYSAKPNPASNWTAPGIGKLQDSSQQPINAALFSLLDQQLRPLAESRFLSTPLNPAKPPSLLLSATYVAVSDVNVTDWHNYAWADAEALSALAAAEPKQSVGSVETTHGVVRLVVPSKQYLFVSGIANRVGYFNMEVAPRPYAQDFAASHNAGVCVAWIVPTLMA
jgi:hypothetical protein